MELLFSVLVDAEVHPVLLVFRRIDPTKVSLLWAKQSFYPCLCAMMLARKGAHP